METPDTKINKKYIKNNYKCINLHMITPNPLYLLTLIENAKDIHVIENSLALMIYYLQHKKIININYNIYFHTYARKRRWKSFYQYEFDNMLLSPKLDNWTILSQPLID